MYKIIPEESLREKVAELLENRHWRRVCLLILLLLPQGKLASRYFIYNKIEEWGLWELPCNREIDDVMDDKTNTLSVISKTLYILNTEGFLHKEDLSRMPPVKFEKFCRERVLGRREVEFSLRWVQSVFYLSPKGRKLAKETLFPPKKLFHNFFRLNRKGGNRKSSACA